MRQLRFERSRFPLRVSASLVLVLVVAALTLIAPRPAHACSCSGTPLSEYADEVDLAIAGLQIDMIDYNRDINPFSSGITMVLKVDRVYKGRAGSVVEVRSHSAGGGDCGTEFGGMGITGVAAFYDEDDVPWVGWCSSHVTIAELEEVFGGGYPPDERLTLPTARDAWTRALLVTSAAMAVLVCVVAIRRRRRAAADGESQNG